MINSKKTVIVGGGIAGLFTALVLERQDGAEHLILVDKNKIGGLFNCHEYSDYGKFDIGTHILSESGDTEIDHIL